jgi:lysophospholipase L1-like esterase
MRALIISDSVALPRPGIIINQTWPEILKDRLGGDLKVYVDAARNRTTDFLSHSGFNNLENYEIYEPDLVIINLGICDSSPRVWGGFERLNKILFKALNLNILKLLPKGVLKKLYSKKNAIISKKTYLENIENYSKKASSRGSKVILINIACCENSLTNFYGIKNQANEYNEASCKLSLENLFYVDLKDFNEKQENFIEDGYHLSVLGHFELYKIIYQALQKYELCRNRG